MKDNFSKQSDLYAKFRPSYPKKLFDFLLPLVTEKKCAWDCGTGNGQVAAVLSEYFDEVYATDISAQQINNATKKKNIFYCVENAEETILPGNTFNLITVAQAIHWFDFEKFYQQVNKTLKPEGILAIIGYDLFRINKDIDFLVDEFYKKTTGPYWDKERKHIDAHYTTIPFPFKEIKAPHFFITYTWEINQALGFLNTWSGVQHYIKKNNENPVEKFSIQLKEAWGKALTRKVTFPVFMRVGKNNSCQSV